LLVGVVAVVGAGVVEEGSGGESKLELDSLDLYPGLRILLELGLSKFVFVFVGESESFGRCP